MCACFFFINIKILNKTSYLYKCILGKPYKTHQETNMVTIWWSSIIIVIGLGFKSNKIK